MVLFTTLRPMVPLALSTLPGPTTTPVTAGRSLSVWGSTASPICRPRVPLLLKVLLVNVTLGPVFTKPWAVLPVTTLFCTWWPAPWLAAPT